MGGRYRGLRPGSSPGIGSFDPALRSTRRLREALSHGSGGEAREDGPRNRSERRGLVRPQHARRRLEARRLRGLAASRTARRNPFVLRPGEPMCMYHWETDQEAFLVVSGEAILIVE